MKQQALNPYLPSYEYVPDSEPRVFGDRLYVYGSHDRFDGPDFCVNDYVCWSAPLDDLGNWRDEGVIYRKEQDPRNTDGKMFMCAPDCVQGPDGRYYLYYQLHVLQCTSVAVADSPTGPFAFYGYVQHPDGKPWGEKRGDCFAFDPGVLVDDDGRAYLYVGFSTVGLFKTVLKLRGNQVEESVCLELEPDMKTVKGGEHPIVPGPAKAKGTEYDGHGFFEASSIRKIGKKYYYVYSSILSHELCYAVSDSPTGGFRYGGTLVSIGDIGYQGNTVPVNYTGNTHGGMVQVNGQWYIFYHRQTNRQKCARQACAEKITILPDGSIPQAEITSCGLNGGPLAGKGTYEARIACNLSSRQGTFPYLKTREKDKKGIHPYFTQSGADREQDGDAYIANMTDGAWAGFKYFSFAGDENKISVTVRGTASGTLCVRTARSGVCAAKIKIQPSVGYTSTSAGFSVPAGVRPLYFEFSGTGAFDFRTFTVQ